MHVRINIPAWGRAELWHAARALTGKTYHAALSEALTEFAPNWKPHLRASARDSLALAVQALCVQRVAVPGYVCPAVLTGLRAGGAAAVAVDVAPDSFRYDAAQLRQAVESKAVEAVLAPNTYGLDQDFSMLSKLGVPVIEDAAYQAGYTDAQGQKCGLRGNVGVWSFNFKALTGIGGGVLWFAEGLRLASRSLRLAEFGVQIEDLLSAAHKSFSVNELPLFANYALRSVAQEHLPKALGGAAPPQLGEETKTRAALHEIKHGAMSELQAALALTQWQRRAELTARQAANSAVLEEMLIGNETLQLVADTAGQTKVHLFPLLVRGVSDCAAEVYRVRRKLYAAGVQTETPYPVILGERAKLPNAHNLAARLVLVPCHASLSVERVSDIAPQLYAQP